MCIDKGHHIYQERYSSDPAFRRFINSRHSNFVKFPTSDLFYTTAREDGVSVLKLEAGDFLIWSSSLPNSGLCPRDDAITGRLRQFVQYITMYPATELKLSELEDLSKARRKAVGEAVTTSHQSWVSPVNNRRGRGREHPTTPKSCFKTRFTEDEVHLIDGTDPSVTSEGIMSPPEHLFEPGCSIDYRDRDY
jgi:hypothetical protein